MELADQQNLEAEGAVSGAEIPVSPETASPNESPRTEKPLSLRETLEKSVETVRTEEAKRARDTATGKFVPKTEEKLAAEKPEIPKTTEAKPEASPAEGPPSAWKGIWESLTPEARALAVKRETEVSKGFEEYRSKTAQLQEITQVFEPIRHVLQQQGITSDAQAVKSLVQWEGAFRNPQTRLQAFHNLARQYGVDLSTLAQNSPAPSPVQDIPDHLRPVLDQFGQVAQKVTNLETQLQRSQEEKVSQELSVFAKDKPHFDKVRGLMGHLMTPPRDHNGNIIGPAPAQDLESAYQQATRIHPDVSAQIEAERVAKETAERERTQAEKAQKARLAAVSPTGRSPNGAPAAPAQKGGTKVRDAILSSISALRDEQRA